MLCSSVSLLHPTHSLQEDLCTHRRWVENAVLQHPVIHVQKPDKMTVVSKVFLTGSPCSENSHFFELWAVVFLIFLWYLQIFHCGGKKHQFRQCNLRGFFPDVECAKLLADVGCSYNACKGTEYSARVPPPSWIPRTIWMLCHSHVPFRDLHRLAHFLLCKSRHAQLLNEGAWGKGMYLFLHLEKTQCLPHFLPK